MDKIHKICQSDGKGQLCQVGLVLRVFTDTSASLTEHKCKKYLLFHSETTLGNGFRAVLYFCGLAYCFIGLSAITACFFRSMANVVKQTREVARMDPDTGAQVVKRERIWNYTLADISLLAFGTSFPQISLATIDAIRNLGQLYAGGLGPGTLVGSAAFDLFPIHAVCVVVPKRGTVKRISDLGVWLVEITWSFWAYIWLYIILQVWTPNVVTVWEAGLTVLQFALLMLHAYIQDKGWPFLSIPLAKHQRPEDWVPAESSDDGCQAGNHEETYENALIECTPTPTNQTVDIFSIHSIDESSSISEQIPAEENVEFPASYDDSFKSGASEWAKFFSIWLRQFQDALIVEVSKSRKNSSFGLKLISISWQLILLPWKILFAFVPPCDIAHGWISFICSLCFITGIAYVVTKLTDLISCVTGINPYVIAFTALASGTSWPDLVASKIAAERQKTADSAIANITCSNSVNIFVGIGVPWLIDTTYNLIAFKEPLRINNAGGLSFSLVVYFITFILCTVVLVMRRYFFGGELGGPRIWAWITSVFFMFLWITFVVLSSLKVSHII